MAVLRKQSRSTSRSLLLVTTLLAVGGTVYFLVWVGHLDPARASAWGTWVQAIAVIAALGFAAAQIREMRIVREAQSRPYVSVRLDLDTETREAYFVCQNFGTTAALDVAFSFEPPLKTSASFDSSASVPGSLLDPSTWILFRDGISVLAPGEQIRTALESMRKRADHIAELPGRYVVTVSYAGGNRKKFDRERFVFDFDMLGQVMFAESSASMRNQLVKLATSVEKIEKHLSSRTSE
jgi:hypothetical protein